MSVTEARSDQRRSTFEWAIRAASVLALITTALQLIAVLVAAGGVPETLGGNPITATIETTQALHPVGQNSYGGSAYIADDATITATQVTAQVRDAAASVRIGLAFGPLAWAATGAGVALCLALAFGHLAAARPNPRRASRLVVIAAAATAFGTSAGQILDEVARTGLQGVMWHGAHGVGGLGSGAGFTFQFGWLAIAVGALAVAAVIGRASDVPDQHQPAI